MKGKITFILLGILIALSVYVYLVEVRGKAEKERAEIMAKDIFALKESEVKKITIQRPDNTLICERYADEWRLLSPVQARGFQSNVKSLVSAVLQMVIEREIPEDVGWSDYGLDPPQFTVAIESMTGKIDSVFLGEENPTGNYLFARKPGDPRILLTGIGIQTSLTKAVFELRDQDVLRFETDQVQKLVLNRRGEEEIIIQKEEEDWKIIKPHIAYANRQVVNEIIRRIGEARIKSFEDEEPLNLSQYGLRSPEYDITLIVSGEDSLKRFFVGKEKETNRFYAKHVAQSPVFTVDNVLVDELKHTLFDLFEKKIVRFEKSDIWTVEFFRQGEPYFICHKDTAEEWWAEFPMEAIVKDWRINSLFSFLEQVEIDEYVEENSSRLNQYGLFSPETELCCKDKEGRIVVHLATGKKKGDKFVYVLNNVTNWVSVATENLIQNFNPNIDEYIEISETE